MEGLYHIFTKDVKNNYKYIRNNDFNINKNIIHRHSKITNILDIIISIYNYYNIILIYILYIH